MSQPKTTNPSDQELTVVHRRELSELSGKEGHRWWVAALAGLAILVILHLPIVLMHQDETTAISEEAHGQLFAIVNEDTEGISASEKSLWQWIHLTEPSQWYYPTPEGFSRFNRRPTGKDDPLPPPYLPGYTQPARNLPALKFPPSVISAALPPMNGQDFLKLGVFIADTPEPGSEPQEQLARWRRIGGGTLQNPPDLGEDKKLLQDEDIRKSLLSQGCKPTILEVNFRPGIPLPRILVRDTCGVDALDMAARRALRNALYSRHLNDQPCEKPFALFFEVDWRM